MSGSSSANKVARVAAKSGSRSGPNAAKQRNWMFAASVVAVVALGGGVLAFARSENKGIGKNDTPPRAQIEAGKPYDHWHAAFAFSVCGEELPPVQMTTPDPLGIHTHTDGLIHIHPFSTQAAGERATMQRFFKQEGIVVTDEGFTLQDGTTYKTDTTECGGKPTVLRMAHWARAVDAADSEPDQVFESDFGAVKLTEDLGAYTISLDVEGADIPAPSASAQIEELGSADGATGSDLTTPGSTPTTATPEETETTSAPETETTTAPEAETTTTAAAG